MAKKLIQQNLVVKISWEQKQVENSWLPCNGFDFHLFRQVRKRLWPGKNPLKKTTRQLDWSTAFCVTSYGVVLWIQDPPSFTKQPGCRIPNKKTVFAIFGSTPQIIFKNTCQKNRKHCYTRIYHISIYHISNIKYHISYIIYQISNIKNQISYIKYHLSNIKYQKSYIIYHITYIKYHIYHISYIINQKSNIIYHIS